MKRLLTIAASYGLAVHGAHLVGERVGRYIPELQRIYFDLSLPMPERRTVIAHEIAHAHYGHDCDTESHERQADAFAAQLLIDPERYAELERINHDANWIAEEMNIAPYAVEDYRRYCLQRFGDVTYANARMGSAQWAHRAPSV